MKRRLIAALVIATLPLGLAACNTATSDSARGSAPTQEATASGHRLHHRGAELRQDHQLRTEADHHRSRH